MLRIGLTGGIGAGKSEVAGRLAGYGAVVIDADQLAREVVAPGTDGLREVVEAFGSGVLDTEGRLDRAAVAAAVFDDEAARRRLEGIIHPRVRARTAQRTAAAGDDAVVVNDVPLLVETGLAGTYHLVVVVEAAEEIRLARLTGGREISQEQAQARIRAQADDETRRAAADVVLRNDGNREELYAEVDALWRDRLIRYEQNVRLRCRVAYPERLRLIPYHPGWPARYQRIAARVGYATGGRYRVDHVGSTAVPGLPARDVVDVQLAVPDLATADALAEPLAEAGFPPVTGRERVHSGADPVQLVQLHLRPAGGQEWRSALLLRDWLRADRAARAEYAAVKQRLAASTGSTREYVRAREPWFGEALPRAERWAAAAGWVVGG